MGTSVIYVDIKSFLLILIFYGISHGNKTDDRYSRKEFNTRCIYDNQGFESDCYFACGGSADCKFGVNFVGILRDNVAHETVGIRGTVSDQCTVSFGGLYTGFQPTSMEGFGYSQMFDYAFGKRISDGHNHTFNFELFMWVSKARKLPDTDLWSRIIKVLDTMVITKQVLIFSVHSSILGSGCVSSPITLDAFQIVQHETDTQSGIILRINLPDDKVLFLKNETTHQLKCQDSVVDRSEIMSCNSHYVMRYGFKHFVLTFDSTVSNEIKSILELIGKGDKPASYKDLLDEKPFRDSGINLTLLQTSISDLSTNSQKLTSQTTTIKSPLNSTLNNRTMLNTTINNEMITTTPISKSKIEEEILKALLNVTDEMFKNSSINYDNGLIIAFDQDSNETLTSKDNVDPEDPFGRLVDDRNKKQESESLTIDNSWCFEKNKNKADGWNGWGWENYTAMALRTKKYNRVSYRYYITVEERDKCKDLTSYIALDSSCVLKGTNVGCTCKPCKGTTIDGFLSRWCFDTYSNLDTIIYGFWDVDVCKPFIIYESCPMYNYLICETSTSHLGNVNLEGISFRKHKRQLFVQKTYMQKPLIAADHKQFTTLSSAYKNRRTCTTFKLVGCSDIGAILIDDMHTDMLFIRGSKIGDNYKPERENWTCTYEVSNCKRKLNSGSISVIGDFFPSMGVITREDTNIRTKQNLGNFSQCDVELQWVYCQYSSNKDAAKVPWFTEDNRHRNDQLTCVYFKTENTALDLKKGFLCASYREIFTIDASNFVNYLTNEQLDTLTKPISESKHALFNELSNCYPNCIIKDDELYKKSWRSGHQLEIHSTKEVSKKVKCLKLTSKNSLITVTEYGIDFTHSSSTENKNTLEMQNCLIKFVNVDKSEERVPYTIINENYDMLESTKDLSRIVNVNTKEHLSVESIVVKDLNFWNVLWNGVIPESVTLKTVNGTTYTIQTDMLICKNLRYLGNWCHDFMRNSKLLSRIIEISFWVVVYLVFGGIIQIKRFINYIKYCFGFKTEHLKLLITKTCFVYSKSSSFEILTAIKNSECCCEVSTSVARVYGFSTKREIIRPLTEHELSLKLSHLTKTIHVFSHCNLQRKLAIFVIMAFPQYEILFWALHCLWLIIGSVPYLYNGIKKGFERNIVVGRKKYSSIIKEKHAKQISKSHGMPRQKEIENILDDVGIVEYTVTPYKWKLHDKLFWLIFFLMINHSRAITYSIVSDCNKNGCQREFVLDNKMAAMEGNELLIDLTDKISNKPIGTFKIEILNFTIKNTGTYDYTIAQVNDVNTCYYFNDEDDCDTNCKKPWLMTPGSSADFSNDFWSECKPKLNTFKSIGAYSWSTKTEYTELNEGFCAGWVNLSPDFTKPVYRSFVMEKSSLSIYFKVRINTAEHDFEKTYFSDGSGLIEDNTNLFDISLSLSNFIDSLEGKMVLCKFDHGAMSTLNENCIITESSFNSDDNFMKYKGENFPPVMWRGPNLNSKITDTLSACACSGQGEPWCDCDCTFDWNWSGIPIIDDLDFKESGLPLPNEQCITEISISKLNVIEEEKGFCIDYVHKTKEECLNEVKGQYSDQMKWLSVKPVIPEGFKIKRTSCSHILIEIKGNVKLPFNPKQKIRELLPAELELNASGCWGRPNMVNVCITPKVPGTAYFQEGSVTIPSFLVFRNTNKYCFNSTAAYENPNVYVSVLESTTGKTTIISKPITLKLCHIIEVGGNHAEGSLGSNYSQVSDKLDYYKIGILIISVIVILCALSCLLSIVLKAKEVVRVTGHKKIV